jgi:alpha,alpha-trehalase
MLNAYILATGNLTILERALPIATVRVAVACMASSIDTLQAEMQWWTTNRTIAVTSPYTNRTHMVAHYAVVNSAPRPEVLPFLRARGVHG